jgi:hypothetical protein
MSNPQTGSEWLEATGVNRQTLHGGQTVWQGNAGTAYQPPVGGGGITNSIQTANGTVTFGHGGRHVPPGHSVASVERAIANHVPKLSLGERYEGNVLLDGVSYTFRARGLGGGTVNVGTYYITP